MTHIWVKDLLEHQGMPIEGVYLVKERVNGVTRAGDPYVALSLSDKTGDVDAKLWGCPKDRLPFLTRDKVVWVRSEVSVYKDRPQLRILELAPQENGFDPAIFIDSSERDPEEMYKELLEILSSIKEPFLRALVQEITGDYPLMADFREAPAAKALHHNFLGGLLEHTLSVVRLAQEVSLHYPFLNKDLLLTSAFLHDLGKIRELRWRPYSIDYTDEGRLIGHIVLGLEILKEKMAVIKDFPWGLRNTISHIILSHHGVLEFGSPKRPKILEAVALNLIDDLDAKICGVKLFLEKDTNTGNWTGYHRLFERFFLKRPVYETTSEQVSVEELEGEGV